MLQPRHPPLAPQLVPPLTLMPSSAVLEAQWQRQLGPP